MKQTKTLCPICNQELLETDELIAKWYEPKKWFVLSHLRNGETFCGMADHHIVSAATAAMRACSQSE